MWVENIERWSQIFFFFNKRNFFFFLSNIASSRPCPSHLHWLSVVNGTISFLAHLSQRLGCAVAIAFLYSSQNSKAVSLSLSLSSFSLSLLILSLSLAHSLSLSLSLSLCHTHTCTVRKRVMFKPVFESFFVSICSFSLYFFTPLRCTSSSSDSSDLQRPLRLWARERRGACLRGRRHDHAHFGSRWELATRRSQRQDRVLPKELCRSYNSLKFNLLIFTLFDPLSCVILSSESWYFVSSIAAETHTNISLWVWAF